ncbi:zinc finger protein ZPR1-like [Lytechinus variegatus]|uniref:zinc finger protein ZPR1-like n=1 Tax=Lytechinus variegatus TaxID=7654 RepID=UPI001BB15092|nr:zinc finger protein ZPR1-like [Lytechinus variegatus]
MATEEQTNTQPLMKDISGDLDDLEATEIESLCVNCMENGTTKLLLTRIPFFKSVIISSFDCPHCHSFNSEIQPASALQPQGCIYNVEIKTDKDMNRQVVKSNSASVRIPELDFEIPGFTQKGSLTTVEGVLQRAVEGLEQEQPLRRALQPEVAEQIDAFIEKLKNIPKPFHVVLDDPAGNSFVENPLAPKQDPAMKVSYYERTKEQLKQLGFADGSKEDSAGDAPQSEDTPKDTMNNDDDDGVVAPEEVFEFAVNCGNCEAPAVCRMKPISIPFFKEVIIMAMSCDACNTKTNEIKSGGGIEDKGRKITLKMTDVSDLSRDVLRSGTCQFEIPEFDFLHDPIAGQSGKFTTIEGLLVDVKNALQRQNPLAFGDSAVPKQSAFAEFFEKMDKVIRGELFVTIILTDPAGNSYLQNVYAPESDPEMTIEDYERTEDENDFLGLTHMKTENYGEEEYTEQNAEAS